MMNRIDKKLKEEGKLLSIYFTAGYPNLDDTVDIIFKLQESGVDMIEIGLPFSDPTLGDSLGCRRLRRNQKVDVHR